METDATRVERSRCGRKIVWEETDRQRVLGDDSSGRELPIPELISFGAALERLQDQEFWMGHKVITKALVLSDEERRNLQYLHDEVRNRIVHFIPTLMVVDLNMLKSACLDALRVMEFLVFESGTFWEYDDKLWKKRASTSCSEMREDLSRCLQPDRCR